MDLLYFRFDDQGTIITMHVQCKQLQVAQQLLARAQQRGFTPTARLVEYALFSAGRTIQPREVPNFHFYYDEEFLTRWHSA